ncbi:GNAT superfamily N-acetyltransferase [Paenibacillus sp. BK720]|nr:GNAT superfamily N-acetyltransferase [Paenibacillus sp. BK720]
MIIQACAMDEIKPLVAEYLKSLSSPFDSFLEEHILSSAFYRIQDGQEDIGYYALHNGELMTQFYIRRSSLRKAQALFIEALERHAVKNLFVPTCDELFVSLAIDRDYKIHKQAYFFQDSGVEISVSTESDAVFRPAGPQDLPVIQQVCGDFLNNYEQWLHDGGLFVYYKDQDLLGIGVMEQSKLLEGFGSIGMFTNEAHRKRGYGTALIVQMRNWCKARGITAICGCWYYNEASKRTLERAGMVTKTRLLNIEVSLKAEKEAYNTEK